MLEGINDTVIVLIPKNKDAKELKEYRPMQCHLQGDIKMFGQ